MTAKKICIWVSILGLILGTAAVNAQTIDEIEEEPEEELVTPEEITEDDSLFYSDIEEITPEEEFVPYEMRVKSGFGRYFFSFSPILGMIYGQGEEILYKYPDKTQFVSQLLWDLKPLFYSGFVIDFGKRDSVEVSGVNASLSLKYGWPLKTGIMEDRDWLNDNEDYLTHFSRHTAYSQNALLLDLSAGYSWKIRDNLSIGANGVFTYMHYSWSGENGFSQYPDSSFDSSDYPEWDKSYYKDYVYGKIIIYNQNWLIFSPGINLKWKIHPIFSIKAFFNYSPLIYVLTRDDHLIPDENYQGQAFWDYCSFGHFIDGNLESIFTFSNNLDLGLSISYRYIFGSRGPSDVAKAGIGSTGIVYQNQYEAGTGYNALDIGLYLKMSMDLPKRAKSPAKKRVKKQIPDQEEEFYTENDENYQFFSQDNEINAENDENLQILDQEKESESENDANSEISDQE